MPYLRNLCAKAEAPAGDDPECEAEVAHRWILIQFYNDQIIVEYLRAVEEIGHPPSPVSASGTKPLRPYGFAEYFPVIPPFILAPRS